MLLSVLVVACPAHALHILMPDEMGASAGRWCVVLRAAGPSGQAYEDGNIGHGVLSYKWARALQTVPVDGGGLDLLRALSSALAPAAEVATGAGFSCLVEGSAPPVLPLRGTSGTTRAVLIGVDAYPDGVPALRYAAADAQLLRDTLMGRFAPPDRCLLLNADEGEARPTRARIVEAVMALAEAAQPQDTLVFCFAGRGLTTIDSRDMLLPADVEPQHLDETVVDLEAVLHTLKQSRASGVLALLDCCFQSRER